MARYRSLFRKVVAYGLLVAIVAGSFLPNKEMASLHLIGSDKLYHAAAYMFLMLAFLFPYRRKPVMLWRGVVGSIWLLGALIEYFQPILSPGRERDFFDLLANSTGILVAVLAILLWRRINYGRQMPEKNF